MNVANVSIALTDSTTQLPEREPVLRVVPMPADVNQHGDIFGGWIMAQVDIAGGVVAARQARGRVATVAVNSFTFKQPVSVGDLVSFYAEITKTGRTSVTLTQISSSGLRCAYTSTPIVTDVVPTRRISV